MLSFIYPFKTRLKYMLLLYVNTKWMFRVGLQLGSINWIMCAMNLQNPSESFLVPPVLHYLLLSPSTSLKWTQPLHSTLLLNFNPSSDAQVDAGPGKQKKTTHQPKHICTSVYLCPNSAWTTHLLCLFVALWLSYSCWLLHIWLARL